MQDDAPSELLADCMIDYPDSPTGKAYLGIAKKPLMANVGGYGYQGVLLQDSAREYV